MNWWQTGLPQGNGPRTAAVGTVGATVTEGTLTPAQEELVQELHRRLLEEIDIAKLSKVTAQDARQIVSEAAQAILAREYRQITGVTRDLVIQRLLDEALGLGPLEQLMRDSSISEIMVNSPSEVYYEREGRIYHSGIRFRDDEHIMRVVHRILAPLGRRVDEASPMVDARLQDGSRVNVIIPPLSPRSPVVTIRRFRADKMTMDDLVSAGTLTPQLAQFLGACVKARLNILVSGGTGTGKTTLLNALSAFIPPSERIITIEDPVELKLQQPHVISLEARPPSIEGRGEVTQRDLLRNALRMRPDRIIVGEVRGPEAFDMLNAMNTGHEGSLTTVHANSPRDALARVENMVLMAGFDLPQRAIREQIASALDIIIQIARFSDGVRRVTHVTEVVGMEGTVITLQDVFRFEQRGVDAQGRVQGVFVSTGIRPTFADKFAVAGIDLPPDIFVGGGW
nr:type II/IV secretion system protein [uncultured bacterium]